MDAVLLTGAGAGAGPEHEEGPDAGQLEGSPRVSAWREVATARPKKPPRRSGAASVVVGDCMYIFGGYGGEGRLDDFWEYNFETRVWRDVEYASASPGQRENNGVVEHNGKLYLFGGYNGCEWLNDFHEFDLASRVWTEITPVGSAPASRFGYVSMVHDDVFLLFGGYDGSAWLNDMHEFTFSTKTWRTIKPSGDVPSHRSCPAWTKHLSNVYVFGGYDGSQRMNDFYVFNLDTYHWTQINTSGEPPSPRYFHSCAFYGQSFYVFGGYNGSDRLNDFHEFDFRTQTWKCLSSPSKGGPENGVWGRTEPVPSGRSSLIAQVYKHSLYCFGGYNGRNVLNDFWEYRFEMVPIPPTTLRSELRNLIDNPLLSDVTFSVEGRPVRASRIHLAGRCEHFRAMFFGGMRESTSQDEIEIADVSYEVFMKLLEYLYTDEVTVVDMDSDMAIELLVAAERFLLPRLKCICELLLQRSVTVGNVVSRLVYAHRHNAEALREICLEFLQDHFDDVKAHPSFEQLKVEPELMFELLVRQRPGPLFPGGGAGAGAGAGAGVSGVAGGDGSVDGASTPSASTLLTEEKPVAPLEAFFPEYQDVFDDTEGTRFDWESILQLPFIDEKVVVAEATKADKLLSPDEARRNQHADSFVLCANDDGSDAAVPEALLPAAVYRGLGAATPASLSDSIPVFSPEPRPGCWSSSTAEPASLASVAGVWSSWYSLQGSVCSRVQFRRAGIDLFGNKTMRSSLILSFPPPSPEHLAALVQAPTAPITPAPGSSLGAPEVPASNPSESPSPVDAEDRELDTAMISVSLATSSLPSDTAAVAPSEPLIQQLFVVGRALLGRITSIHWPVGTSGLVFEVSCRFGALRLAPVIAAPVEDRAVSSVGAPGPAPSGTGAPSHSRETVMDTHDHGDTAAYNAAGALLEHLNPCRLPDVVATHGIAGGCSPVQQACFPSLFGSGGPTSEAPLPHVFVPFSSKETSDWVSDMAGLAADNLKQGGLEVGNAEEIPFLIKARTASGILVAAPGSLPSNGLSHRPIGFVPGPVACAPLHMALPFVVEPPLTAVHPMAYLHAGTPDMFVSAWRYVTTSHPSTSPPSPSVYGALPGGPHCPQWSWPTESRTHSKEFLVLNPETSACATQTASLLSVVDSGDSARVRCTTIDAAGLAPPRAQVPDRFAHFRRFADVCSELGISRRAAIHVCGYCVIRSRDGGPSHDASMWFMSPPREDVTLPGYVTTRPSISDWRFSDAAVELLREYIRLFPDVLHLADSISCSQPYGSHLLTCLPRGPLSPDATAILARKTAEIALIKADPVRLASCEKLLEAIGNPTGEGVPEEVASAGSARLDEVLTWVHNLRTFGAPRFHSSTVAYPAESVALMRPTASASSLTPSASGGAAAEAPAAATPAGLTNPAAPSSSAHRELDVPLSHLFPALSPYLRICHDSRAGQSFSLGDRVVLACNYGPVPFGSIGTVVSIHQRVRSSYSKSFLSTERKPRRNRRKARDDSTMTSKESRRERRKELRRKITQRRDHSSDKPSEGRSEGSRPRNKRDWIERDEWEKLTPQQKKEALRRRQQQHGAKGAGATKSGGTAAGKDPDDDKSSKGKGKGRGRGRRTRSGDGSGLGASRSRSRSRSRSQSRSRSRSRTRSSSSSRSRSSRSPAGRRYASPGSGSDGSDHKPKPVSRPASAVDGVSHDSSPAPSASPLSPLPYEHGASSGAFQDCCIGVLFDQPWGIDDPRLAAYNCRSLLAWSTKHLDGKVSPDGTPYQVEVVRIVSASWLLPVPHN